MNIEWLKTALDAIGVTSKIKNVESNIKVGLITHQQAISKSVTGQHQEIRELSDGPAKGQRLRYWNPNNNGGFWGYDISPTDRYTG